VVVRYQSLICDDEARRALVAAHATLNGIDYIEVATEPQTDNQVLLRVYFIPTVSLSSMLAALDGDTSNVRIEGGVRVRPIKVTEVTVDGDHLEVRVDHPGDFSTYTLVIDSAALDPAYAQCEFSFKAGCPSRFDCKPRLVCPPEPRDEPPIDYMAKDYASFRQALVDLIPTLAPDWTERLEADLGIALLELLAYAGDQLSYYQDAVANEAYLETARQRISVRRHARLIDYRMHDGASARAFVHVAVSEDGTLPEGARVLTRIDVPLGSQRPPHAAVIPKKLISQALDAAGAVFETMEEVYLHPRLNRILIYTWGNKQCCLPSGTTSVDLETDLTGLLKEGSFLLFEEAKGPETGLEADADRSHRQVVRLAEVKRTKDPLENVDLTRVSWDLADALTFPLCLSARKAEGTQIEGVSLARSNLVLADHGRTYPEEWHPGDPADPDVSGIVAGPRAYRFLLRKGPLSFRILPPGDNGFWWPASALLQTDPGQAEPQAWLSSQTPGAPPEPWEAVTPHLLDSGPLDNHFAAETGNRGQALIRFGDGQYGLRPLDGSCFRATYRVGVGRAGNVGTKSLVHIILEPAILPPEPLPTPPVIASPSTDDPVPVRNPLSAWGGVDPQPLEQVKQLAPAAFHAEQFRAVTEEDYARAAEKHPEVAKAVATFRWTGSWHTVFVTVDPRGRVDLPLDLQKDVKDWVTRYTLAGYDLEIDPPVYVPLEIEADVCVAPAHFRGQVEEALLAALSSQMLPDGRRRFFHPDNYTFGQSLYLSQLYAAIESVVGVDSAVVTMFQHFGELPNQELERGEIPMGRLEVLRLDNDLSLPENGVLRLNMLGGL
jgi:hypothetical protein